MNIAVACNGGFLKKEDIEVKFSKFKEVFLNDEIKYYSNIDEMFADRDKIEVIFNSVKLSKEKISEFSKLKWVFSYSAGVDSYPMEELGENNVILTNTSGVHKTNIAEQVMGAMIMFSRDFVSASINKLKREFIDLNVSELMGKNLLIVGPGAIGRELARKASAFDMVIDAVRNSNSRETIEYIDNVYNIVSLEKIIGNYDYVVSILPSTKETRKLFDKKLFNKMNKDSVFINVGRGDLVVEEDLINVLENREIKGAYLDVFNEEPLNEESRLWDLDNLIITPHSGGTTPYYLDRSFNLFMDNLKRLKEGTTLNNIIDFNKAY